MRHPFGESISDFVISVGSDNAAILTPNATLTGWSDKESGTQYALAVDSSGTAMDQWVSDSNGHPSQPAYAPDEVLAMWVSANGGPRVLMLCSDLADLVAADASAVAQLQAQLSAHLSAVNPHAVKFSDLADASPSTPLNGQVWAWDSTAQKYKLVNAGTGSGGSFNNAGGNVITIPNGDYTTQAMKIILPAGDRTSTNAPNTFSIFWNAGTDSVPNLQETWRLNEYGEQRLQPSAPNRVASRTKQYNGSQTANLEEWTDFSNNVLASVGPTGAMRAPNLGTLFTFSVTGSVSAATGKHRIYNDCGTALTIRAVRASVGTAPAGSALTVDVNKNGSTIFSTQTNRPSIAAGSNTAKAPAINTTSIADGEYFTVDVDAVGSTTAGADLTVQILAY